MGPPKDAALPALASDRLALPSAEDLSHGSCAISDGSCSGPPRSLLVERDWYTASGSRNVAGAQKNPKPIISSPDSTSRRELEAAALQPSPKRDDDSSWTTLGTTFDKATPSSQQLDEEGSRGRSRAPKPITCSKGNFAGSRPNGDPALDELPSYRLEFPPASGDDYPEDGDILFQPPKESSRSLDVESLLEKYSDQGAELADFLTAQGMEREDAYEPVAAARQHTQRVLAKFWLIQRLKGEGAQDLEYPKPVGRIRHMRKLPSRPRLTRKQLNHMHKLEVDLVANMEDLAINHGKTEGTIAGTFTTQWDDAEKEVPAHVSELLMATGFDKRLFHKRLVPHPEDPEVAFGNDVQEMPLDQSFYQSQIDDIREVHRDAFRQSFEAFRPSRPAPSTKIDFHTDVQLSLITSTEVDSLTNIVVPPEPLVPDWFPVFDNLNIIRLMCTTPSSRFIELVNNLSRLQETVKAAEEEERKPKWDKEWHEPRSGWSTRVQRQNGGWWKCRSGPDAPRIERTCRMCRNAERRSETQSSPRGIHQEKLDLLVEAIDQAMKEVGQRDIAIVRNRFLN